MRNSPEKFPIQRSCKGYQINFCYNTQCANYSVPPKFPNPRDLGKMVRDLGNYRIKPNDDGSLLIECEKCRTSTTTYSNKGIVQEAERLRAIYQLHVPSCPNTGLREDKRKDIPNGLRYEKYTKTVRGVEKRGTRLKKPCPNQHKDILSYPDNYWLDSKNTKKLKNTKGLPKIVFPDSNGKYHHLREAV